MWPSDRESLRAAQESLALADASRWTSPRSALRVAGCWVSFPRGLSGPGQAGDAAWVAAVVMQEGRTVDQVVKVGAAGASYEPGLLALRLGGLVSGVVSGLADLPDVLMVDATGRDHPRGAGFALHLGAELDLPSVGVTHRPLLAKGDWPGERRGDTSELRIDGQVVACWVRTQPEVRPLVVHPGWRIDLEQAVDLVLATTTRHRTPEPLRRARHLARRARGSQAR